MNDHITFATLRQFLFDFGLSERNVKDALLFEHPTLGVLFLFRTYRPEDVVHIKDLMAVRKMLDERGLMTRRPVDGWLWPTSPPSGPSSPVAGAGRA